MDTVVQKVASIMGEVAPTFESNLKSHALEIVGIKVLQHMHSVLLDSNHLSKVVRRTFGTNKYKAAVLLDDYQKWLAGDAGQYGTGS